MNEITIETEYGYICYTENGFMHIKQYLDDDKDKYHEIRINGEVLKLVDFALQALEKLK